MKKSGKVQRLLTVGFFIIALTLPAIPGYGYTLYQAADKPELKFSGFLQVLYKTMQSDVANVDTAGKRTDRDGFNVPRVRLGAGGKLRDDVSFKLEADFKLSNISLMEGTITYSPLKALSLVAGQFKTPLSREYLIPTADSDTILASLPIDKITTKYDVGLLAKGKILDEKVNLQGGIFNGEGQNAATANEQFYYVGQVSLKPLKFLEAGGAFGGQKKHADADTDYLYDGFLYLSPGDLSVKAEFIGKKTATTAMGISGLVGYSFLEKKLQPLVRGEWYEPNTDTDDNEITRVTGGLNWFIKKHDLKLSANYVYEKESGASINNNQLLVQAQIKY